MKEVTKRLSFASRFSRGVFVGQGTDKQLGKVREANVKVVIPQAK